jgi:hypothetical protein
VDLRGLEPRWLSPCKGNPGALPEALNTLERYAPLLTLRSHCVVFPHVTPKFGGSRWNRTIVYRLRAGGSAIELRTRSKRRRSTGLSYAALGTATGFEPATSVSLVHCVGIEPTEPEGARSTAAPISIVV